MKKTFSILPIIVLFIACNNHIEILDGQRVQLEVNEHTRVLNKDLLSVFEFTMLNQALPIDLMESIDKYDGVNIVELQDVKLAENIIGSYTKSLAIGFYGAQLLYVIEKDKFAKVPSLLKAVNTLSDNIGFPEIIDVERMAFYESNKDNRDSLVLMAKSIFKQLSIKLQDNGQIEQATLILISGKIESLRLGVLSLSGSTDTEALKIELRKESNAISELLLILEPFKADGNITRFIKSTKIMQENMDIKYFKAFEF